jgi:hypothetical protein
MAPGENALLHRKRWDIMKNTWHGMQSDTFRLETIWKDKGSHEKSDLDTKH